MVGGNNTSQEQQPTTTMALTSTTAPGKAFGSRADLQRHYKSEWHKYNLKRREAGLPLLLETDFEARLQAAQALLSETKAKGRDHLKKGGGGSSKKELKNNNKQQQQANGVVVSSQAAAHDRIKEQAKKEEEKDGDDAKATGMPQEDKGDGGDGGPIVEDNDATGTTAAALESSSPPVPMDESSPQQQQAGGEEEGNAEGEDDDGEDEDMIHVEIDPRQCLFDKHVSVSVSANVDRMQRKYGFFVPDREHLIDVTGLVGYCHEKVKLGHACLYCQRVFRTWQGCQKHMISKQHCKLLYEPSVDLEDLSVFYNFEAANRDFLRSIGAGDSGAEKKQADSEEEAAAMEVEDDDDDDDENEVNGSWEDISDDDEPMEEDGGDDEFDDDEEQDYQEQFAVRMGFEVTALGELVLPDGRIVGHRDLRRYYKQRLRTDDRSEAVEAAQLAARERLYRGRVYTLEGGGAPAEQQRGGGRHTLGQTAASSAALIAAGISPSAAAGRAGRGILTGPAGNYSQLSVYRFRAALRKERAGDRRGKRLYEKTSVNMNKMDKKGNRMVNSVNVQMAPR